MLQQGPSSLPESRVLLRDYAKRFAGEAKNAGARTALYMVWPAKARERDFDAVSESYALAAEDADGVLLPAGDAWRDAWRHDPSLELYAEDGFHPSRLGSYLAALTIWRGLSGQPVIGLPGSTASIPGRFACCRMQPRMFSSVSLAGRNSSPFDDRTPGRILGRP